MGRGAEFMAYQGHRRRRRTRSANGGGKIESGVDEAMSLSFGEEVPEEGPAQNTVQRS